MSIILADRATENSAYAIKGIQFLDEDNTPTLPNSAPTWSMCRSGGEILHTGTLSISLTNTLVFNGAQLIIDNSELTTSRNNNGATILSAERRVTVNGQVNTSLGNDLEVSQEFIFWIDNIVCIGN